MTIIRLDKLNGIPDEYREELSQKLKNENQATLLNIVFLFLSDEDYGWKEVYDEASKIKTGVKDSTWRYYTNIEKNLQQSEKHFINLEINSGRWRNTKKGTIRAIEALQKNGFTIQYKGMDLTTDNFHNYIKTYDEIKYEKKEYLEKNDEASKTESKIPFDMFFIHDIFKYKKQIIIQGAPGTGKTYLAKIITKELTNNNPDLFKIIQFHPAYSYEDFVRGIITETTESGQVVYSIQNKILAEFADKAINNPKANYVLIIDEINRANLPAVLGELIYTLEYRGKPVESVYEYEGSREIILPENLFIIGTMNTADRSVGNIDYAIRRRFAFITLVSDKTVVENYYENEDLRNYAVNLYERVESLFNKDNLSPDYKKDDIMIGHSYFLASDEAELKIKLEYEIKPILLEYVKDGIFISDDIEQKIKAL